MRPFQLDDDLILEYLAECREHLGTIETDLLSMEQQGAAIDEQLVNRVFRAAHSIKGGAGFFDLLKIRELAHRTESVLDMVRSGQIIPTSEVVSILLMAFDKLRILIQDHAGSNDADITEFTDALTRLVENHLSPRQKRCAESVVTIALPDGRHPIQTRAFDLDQARRNGRKIYIIQYDLIHDIQRRGKNPLEVLAHLGKCGTMIETEFDLDSAGTLDDEPSSKLLLSVLYATVLDSFSLTQILDISPEQVHRIEEDGATVEIESVVPQDETPEESESPAALPVIAVAPSRRDPDRTPTTGSSAPAPQVEATIRLNVALLDGLMTLAGELVLGRNQLNEAVRNSDKQGIRAGAHRVSMVTSELQEAVSLTRMQPVSSLFSKFPRLVRDLAGELNKEVQIRIEGGEVELDKTILEGLSDPLTHMVRNSVDHGIESPADRVAAGKPSLGTVTLRAKHQAGQVVIEIADDGKGLSGDRIAGSALKKGLITAEQLEAMSEYDKHALIFMPGVSTAEKLSNISGRGVGMDVVKTNLDKLGGKVEIISAPGAGSSFLIKLPLTLAIIPSLLVSDSGERFAIPQVSVAELIRITADQVPARVSRTGDAEVVLLRDRLVPLVHLGEVLSGVKPTGSSKALNIVLVDTGAFEYGLVVDDLHDTVEIVVKPMGRHLQSLRDYAGATILGDGQVAVILDVAGVAQRAGLARTAAQSAQTQTSIAGQESELHSLLLFQNAPGEQCALSIDLVTRVERVNARRVEFLGGRRTMQYEGASLPLLTLRDVASVNELSESQQWVVIIFNQGGRTLGLLAAEPVDMVETVLQQDCVTLRQPGVSGSALINGRTTLLLDLVEVSGGAVGDRTETADKSKPTPSHKQHATTVLVAEDSDFFRGQITRLIESIGYNVVAAEDGQSAWEVLDGRAGDISLVTTDIEMPRLDGVGLAKRIRADSRFTHLPVIALSTLAGEEEMARGMAAGISEYQVKLDKTQLLESIRKQLAEQI